MQSLCHPLWLRFATGHFEVPLWTYCDFSSIGDQNWPLVNLCLGPCEMNSKLLFLTVTTSFHVYLTTTWQEWRYSSTKHHYYLNTCRNHKAWSYHSLSHRRLSSTEVRPTDICFWEIMCSKKIFFFCSFIFFFFCQRYQRSLIA